MAFTKGKSGNPKGREEGSKNKRTVEWEALGEMITGLHAERFNSILGEFMRSDDPEIQEKGAHLYLSVIEYFKPKNARVTHVGDKESPVQIIISKDI